MTEEKKETLTQEENFTQDTKEKGEFQHIFWMNLLFGKEVKKPSADEIKAALEKTFGDVDVVSGDEKLTSFALKKYPVHFKDADLPAQVMMADFAEFDQDSISPMERSQLWDVPNSEELLAGCTHRLMISDFMSAGLDYKERCGMLMDWLQTALELFPDCLAVWIPSAGKLLTAEQVKNCPVQGDDRFVYVAMNARFFNIEGSGDSIVDTLGLYAIGLPDVQYHYHDLDPNSVVNHAYNAASYTFANNAPIKSGETIDGIGADGRLSRELQWRCQYEMSLLQPTREVLDICPGDFAAGQRD